MHAIELHAPALDALQRVQSPQPQARRGEVLVRMMAASFNFLDWAVITGRYPGVTFPIVPIADGAGEVVALGEDVDTLAVGDRVVIHPKSLWADGRGTARNAAAMRGVNRPGALREFASVSADTAVRVPEHLSWSEAASLPIAATTAWNALVTAQVGPGDTVLLLGTGGVALAALQLAKARGATVIITSSSDEKLVRAGALGADHLVNYRTTPAWDAAVLSLTDGVGVDLVIEGGGTDTFARSLAAVRHAGTVFTIGFLSGMRTEVDLLTVIAKAIRVQGSNTGSAEMLRGALAAIAAHRIAPVVDRTYALTDLQDGYAALGRSAHVGKLALTIDW
jgi:NADPH:quinone reductase-like Zn-dependent oxidoreductase